MTTPLDRDQLKRLVRYHRDSLWSHRWQMSPATEELEKQTVQALEHYRDLVDLIDNRPPDADPFQEQPSLPPAEEARTEEAPA